MVIAPSHPRREEPPTAASPGRGARPRTTPAQQRASTGSGGSGSPTRPRGESRWKYSGNRPHRHVRRRGRRWCPRGARPGNAGRDLSSHASTVQVSLAVQQPGQLGVAARRRRPPRPHPSTCARTRSSYVGRWTERKMPIGTCTMLSRRRGGRARTPSTGRRRRPAWGDHRAASAPSAPATTASSPESVRTTHPGRSADPARARRR